MTNVVHGCRQSIPNVKISITKCCRVLTKLVVFAFGNSCNICVCIITGFSRCYKQTWNRTVGCFAVNVNPSVLHFIAVSVVI